jgi:uncharacterized alpha-E superfamily protein
MDQGTFPPVSGRPGTIMRNDAFRFIRLGTFIERADNCACSTLATKWPAIKPKPSVTVRRTPIQWSALLRALSSFEAYTEIYTTPGARRG